MFDKTKKYAISLEGGGFRGAYQAGAIKALVKENIQISAVVGCSIGAMNGALLASSDLDKLEEIWMNFDVKDIFKTSQKDLERAFALDLKGIDLIELGKEMIDIARQGGVDISPLKNLISSAIDVKKLKESDIDFGLVTYCITDKELIQVMKSEIPDESVHNMILASAYLPGFKSSKLDGKYYLDGGYENTIPTNMLVDRAYEDIIEIRLNSGYKEIKPYKKVNVNVIKTNEKLGHFMLFDREKINRNYKLGYFDALKFINSYSGNEYYINANNSEDYYMNFFLNLRSDILKLWSIDQSKYQSREMAIFGYLLPKIIKKYERNTSSYKNLFISLIEDLAKKYKIKKFKVYTINEICKEILKKVKRNGPKKIVSREEKTAFLIACMCVENEKYKL